MTLPTVYTVTGLLKKLNQYETVTSRNKLYEELESGRLVGFKIGNQWRITEPSVLRWIGAETESPTEHQLCGATGCVEPPTVEVEVLHD